MRITEKERRMFQQWGLGISLVLLLVHNFLFGFDFVSETVLTLGTIFFILLFKRNKKIEKKNERKRFF